MSFLMNVVELPSIDARLDCIQPETVSNFLRGTFSGIHKLSIPMPSLHPHRICEDNASFHSFQKMQAPSKQPRGRDSPVLPYR